MTIKNARILVLGGWGLVGSAIIHKLLKHEPRSIIITSLRQEEAESAVNAFRREYSHLPADTFEAWWGNIFTRSEWKDSNRESILSEDASRLEFIRDIVDDLSDDVLHRQALYQLIHTTRPDAVIDCINTATAIAYQDIYSTSRSLLADCENSTLKEESVERLLASLYIPQLVRHIQIVQKSLSDAGTSIYLKVGTSGTGGMGLNIPYTHSEEKPSRVLLSKTAIAGAQSMLLFLMARTPGGPIIKEVKPSAAIAWKAIAYGDIKRKGQPLMRYDMQPGQAKSVQGTFRFDDAENIESVNECLKSVYIDTGENGIFSRAEFETVSSIGQMELVTPEEIAHVVVAELSGGNTGRDIVQGLDATVMGPTYRGGALRERALDALRRLERENNVASIGFEMLGPPRLTKLLFEAHILGLVASNPNTLLSMTAEQLSMKAEEIVSSQEDPRQTILSVGLPILMRNGQNYLRGRSILIPLQRAGVKELEINPANLEKWCHDGWIDLREANMKVWLDRLERIRGMIEAIDANETSSRYEFDIRYWDGFQSIDEGKLAAFILHHEERGGRIKR